MMAAILAGGLSGAVFGLSRARSTISAVQATKNLDARLKVEEINRSMASAPTPPQPAAAGAAVPGSVGITERALGASGGRIWAPLMRLPGIRKFSSEKGVTLDSMSRATDHYAATGDASALDAANTMDAITGSGTELVALGSGEEIAARMGIGEAIDLFGARGEAFRGEVTTGYRGWIQGEGLNKKDVSLGEFEDISALVLRARDLGVDVESIIPSNIKSKLNADQMSSLLSNATKAADAWTKISDGLKNRMVKSGMLDEDLPLENYLPVQLRAGERSLSDLEDYLFDILYKPSDKNIEDLMPGRLVDETFEDLQKRDPAAARALARELEELRLDAKSDKLRTRLDAAQKSFDKKLGSAREELKAHVTTQLAKLRKQVKRGKAKPETLVKSRLRISILEDNLKKIDGDVDEFGDALKNVGPNSLKKTFGNNKTKLTRAQKAFDKPVAPRGTRIDEIKEIARKMHKGGTSLDNIPDNLSAKIGLTEERVLEHDFAHPLFNKLFRTNLSDLGSTHMHQVAPRLFLHERFQGFKLEGEDIALTPGRMMRQNAADATDDNIAAEILKDADRVDAAIRAALGRDRSTLSDAMRTFDAWSQVITKFNTASMLSLLPIAQLGDIPLASVAGGTRGKGLRAAFNPKRNMDLARKVQSEGQPDINVILLGNEAMRLTNSIRDIAATPNDRILKMVGLDGSELLPRSRAQATAHQIADKLVTVSQMASLAAPMTMAVRAGTGHVIGKIFKNDMLNFASLSPAQQRAWLRNGIDARSAERLANFMRTPDGVVNIQGHDFPNLKKLAETDPILADIGTNAASRMASEGTIAPGLLDKPLISRHPLGRIAMQFTSFGYAVGNRVVPMLKREIRNGNMVEPTIVFVGGWIAAMAAQYLRTAMYGGDRFDTLHEELKTPEGMTKFAISAILLIPVFPGMSSQLAEVGVKAVGSAANSVLGKEYLPAGFGRFQRPGTSLISRLGGPTTSQLDNFGRVLAKTFDAIDKEMAGESEEAKESAKEAAYKFYLMLPVVNAMPFRAILRIMGEVFGE
jgi:hypothetical protein